MAAAAKYPVELKERAVALERVNSILKAASAFSRQCHDLGARWSSLFFAAPAVERWWLVTMCGPAGFRPVGFVA